MAGNVEENGELAEAPGLYGPVGISEILVQKLWYRREFSTESLRTVSGKRLKILHPGRWNRLGGPDFLGAEWEEDGIRHEGDVEIHFYARDWLAHRHAENPAFRGVGLHVVVFDPGFDPGAMGGIGDGISTLVLGPYLRESLEEFAWREAMRAFDGVDPLDLAAPLLSRPPEKRRERLREGARRRWHFKLEVARRRLAHADWATACHEVTLEVLGLRSNRTPMANLAVEFPRAQWTSIGPDWIETRLAERERGWRLSGMRPANHPRKRLLQYATLCREHPDWAERFRKSWTQFSGTGFPEETPAAFRRREGLSPWRRALREEVLGGQIASPRFDTLMVDGVLPLWAAADPAREAWAETLWCHWFPGDFPDRLRQFLQVAQVLGRDFPLNNGFQQGAIALLAERDRR